MGVFENFPYSNFHDLNLDWILNEIKNQAGDIADLQDEDQTLSDAITALENNIPTVVQNYLDTEGIGPLPEVSILDNGDVLAVVNGEWAKATAPGATLPSVDNDDNGKVLGVLAGEWQKIYTGRLQPANFPELPYPIVCDAFGQYKIGINLLSAILHTITGSYEDIYVDSDTGTDHSGAAPENNPLKTLKAALARAQNRNAYIHIAGHSIFWDEDLPGSNTNIKQYTWIIDGNGCTAIWGISDPEWVSWPSVVGAYVYESAPKRCSGILDTSTSNIDKFGFYKPYTERPISDYYNLQPGEYAVDTTNRAIYVYPRSGSSISAIYPLRGDTRSGQGGSSENYGLRFSQANATGSSRLYLRNFNYIGNMYTASRDTSHQHINDTMEWIYENCRFSHATIGDLYLHQSADIVYLIDCVGAYAKKDIFNCTCATAYMDTSKIENSVFVNLNCQAIEGGWYDDSAVNTDNLFTAHGGLNILRANCRGYNSRGPMLADVNGCRSANYFVNLYNNAYGDISVAGCTQFNNEQAWRDGLITLVNVYAGDNARTGTKKCNTSCDAEMLGGNLYADMQTVDGAIITPVDLA